MGLHLLCRRCSNRTMSFLLVMKVNKRMTSILSTNLTELKRLKACYDSNNYGSPPCNSMFVFQCPESCLACCLAHHNYFPTLRYTMNNTIFYRTIDSILVTRKPGWCELENKDSNLRPRKKYQKCVTRETDRPIGNDSKKTKLKW